MSVIESLEVLRDLIDDATLNADCAPDRVTVTAGQPSAPSGENCTAIYVWADQIADAAQNDPDACMVRSRLTMAYQIHVCYIATPEDETDAEHAVAADCLHELMGLVWCALVDAKAGDEFGDCAFVELAPMDIQPRLGTDVSALGTVVVPLECPLPSAL